jgi:hypothetical protein
MSVIHPHNAKSGIIETEAFYDKTFGLWFSPNVTTLRYLVPAYDMEIPFNACLSDFRKPRWLSNAYPFIAFRPKAVEFTGPLFSRLNICVRTLSVERDIIGSILI